MKIYSHLNCAPRKWRWQRRRWRRRWRRPRSSYPRSPPARCSLPGLHRRIHICLFCGPVWSGSQWEVHVHWTLEDWGTWLLASNKKKFWPSDEVPQHCDYVLVGDLEVRGRRPLQQFLQLRPRSQPGKVSEWQIFSVPGKLLNLMFYDIIHNFKWSTLSK